MWFLLVPLSAFATNYTVKAGGGGNYTTISACTSAMANGDTCTVYAGTYTENVTISAGALGSIRTVNVNGTDVVTIVGSVTEGSYDSLIGNCTTVPSTPGTCLTVENPSSPNTAQCLTITTPATAPVVENTNFYECGSGYMVGQSSSTGTVSYLVFKGNTLSYSCSTAAVPNVCTAMEVNGDHNLIQGNSFSHVSDGPYYYGAHNYFIGNDFGPTADSDCGSNSSNCHIDLLQSDANVTGGAAASQYLVIESNKVHDMAVTGSFAGSGAHAGPLLQAESCSSLCFNAIIRFDTAYHIAGGGTTDDNSGVTPPPQAWINVKAYNNDWIDMLNTNTGVGADVNGHSHGSSGGSNVNEIYYFTTAGACNGTNPYDAQDTATTGYTYGYSLAYCVNGGTLYGHTYGSGAFTADTGNVQTNPLFNNYAGNDFTLQAGSPALNTGTHLTTVASGDTSTGTSLIVADAGFFQDGSGISGLSADCISVTTVSNHVCVTAVNYSTNTLTLASSITRTVGDSIWLYSDSSGTVRLTGTAPNKGSKALATSGSGGSSGSGFSISGGTFGAAL